MVPFRVAFIAAMGLVLIGGERAAAQTACAGSATVLSYGNGSKQKAFLLAGSGGIATLTRMTVNLDGMGHAYHRDDLAGGGIIALCNGGRPFPAGKADYNASENNAACVRFRADYNNIRAAGFKNPSVGAIRWFGILGLESAVVDGRTVKGVVPVEQADGSGFYVSPTSLEDRTNFPDVKDQRRYVDAEVISAAVIRNDNAITGKGIDVGTFGVAIHRTTRKSAPFIVGDYGPRIGEGSFALTRAVRNLTPTKATLQNRFQGNVDGQEVLWVFFGGTKMAPPYTTEKVKEQAQAAFASWGGEQRLTSCLDNSSIPKANP